MKTADRLINELASGWASNPTDIRLPRAYQPEPAYGGFLRSIRNYLGQKTGTYLTLGALGLAAAGELACGDKNPTGPSPTDMCPNIAGEQPTLPPNMVKDGNGNCVCAPGYIESNGSCVVQPRSSMSISRPANGEKAATPLDIRYSYSDQTGRATHADFMINNEVYHDRSLDGEFQIPEKRADGTDVIGPGNHRLAGYLADDSEAKLEGSDASANFEVLVISGIVRDRIAGGSISGSTITWRGPVTKSARVNSPYEVVGLPLGNYEVTITGNQHVEHKNLSVPVSVSESFPFSVLKWNSGRQDIPGVVYDQTFHGFFDRVGRLIPGMYKWDLKKLPPREIYIVENSNFVPDKFAEFMDILNEVNNESTSKMYCGKVGPLPIRTGTPVNDSYDGGIIVRFGNGSSAGGNWRGYEIVGAGINYSIPDLTNFDRNRRKFIVAHELFHAAFANHDDNNTYPGSLMNTRHQTGTFPNTLSREEELAACIVNDDATRPGNKAPDTNPTYR